MTYLLLGLGLLILGLALASQLQKADPAALARWIRRAGAILALLLGGYLIVSGRLVPALPALIGGALLFGRLRRSGPFRFGSGGPSGGQSSDVETAYLRASLDHATGRVTGAVLQGAFAGQGLESLVETELVALYVECLRDDEPSARLVEAFLDRSPYAATWRQRSNRQTGGTAGRTTAEEARRILGVAEGASAAEIRAAHHKLMMANHPDRGGSDYLAAKINEARDVLLGS